MVAVCEKKRGMQAARVMAFLIHIAQNNVMAWHEKENVNKQEKKKAMKA